MTILPNDPVIIKALRTPIGKYGGSLSGFRPDDMLAGLMQETIRRARLESKAIDEVVIGCANQAGEDNRNIARMASLLAGFPESVPAITLNRLCASGLDAIIDAARRIIIGEANLVVAGGVESMSRAPYVMAKADSAYRLGPPPVFDTSLGWRFFNEKLRARTEPEHNGVTAERLASHYGISRERQDLFAIRSHRLAIESQQNGFFEREIVPVTLKGKKEVKLIDMDEGPRHDTDMQKLAALKPAFLENGTVTAGNSSSLNDGAAVVLLSSNEFARAHGLNPIGRILGFASAGVDPRTMGIGPVPAIKKLLTKYSLTVNDFSTVEINEAFAAQVLSVIDLLEIEEERVNQRGGAIALGHPLGCSGARIVTTMLNHMQMSKSRLGLASLCVGVGQGVCLSVEAF